MNKKATVQILTGLILALACSGATAQTALQQLGAEAGVDAAPLTQQLSAVRAMDAGQAPVVGIPLHGKDVLAGCSALSAKAIMPWNMSSAVVMTQTCLNHVYRADGDYRVKAVSARFGASLCPGANGGGPTCHAMVEVVGIKLIVTGRLMIGNAILEDLNTTLNQRDGKLFGFRAIVENQASILP